MTTRLGFGAFLLGLALGCGGEAQGPPTRSPTLDYPPPPARDAHGQVIGVDGVPPEDRIRQSPTVGPKGPKSAEHPPRKEDDGHGGPPDPCKQIGLKDAQGHSKCKDDKDKE